MMTILDLAQQTGLNPKWVAGTAGGVYHSPCPSCGGTDRFYIQPYKQMSKCLGSYRCRQCGTHGDSIQFAREFLNLSFQEATNAVNATISESGIFKHTTFSSRPIILQKPPLLWIKNAHNFVEQAHRDLLAKPNVLDYLACRGLALEAVKRYTLGWSDMNHFFSRNEWGLEQQISPHGKSRKLWIPKGLVIPSKQSNGEVIRLKVRRSDYNHDDKLPKYIAISGSMNGLSIIGNSRNKIMIVVESELDAYALDYAAGDFCLAVAVGSNIKNPDNITGRLAQHAEKLLICHDNDEAGKKMLEKWQKLYPRALGYPTPLGKDIGEAVSLGLDLKTWFRTA